MKIKYYSLFLLISISVLQAKTLPNVILMMADDLGWGDVGFNGNKIIKTPHLDEMAREGVSLTQFYSVGPVCSPTRAAVLTGRHNFRTAIWSANTGHLRREEITIAEAAKSKGYVTGHFGKWHLGTLSRTMSSKGESRKPAENYSPPWDHGYDRSFVVESSVSTWDPGGKGNKNKNPFYDDGVPLDPNDPDSNLKGGAGRVVMDRVIPFIEKAVDSDKPFLAVIWFNAPHEPIRAGPSYLAMYPNTGDSAQYYGCITEMDEQVGRLQAKLKKLGIYDNTLQVFCSDNGPEGNDPDFGDRQAGVTGGFRGRKSSCYEGGVRVPALAVWPGQIKAGSVVNSAVCTYDYMPTIAEIMGYQMPDQRILDGENMLPVIRGEADRTKSIPFRHKGRAWLVKGSYKMIINSITETKSDEIYDLSRDAYETENINASSPELALAMRKEILAFLDSLKESYEGADYGIEAYKPLGEWHELGVAPASALNAKEKAEKLAKREKKKEKREKEQEGNAE
ncbi:MAG: sulfatase-like hydrolase/transferase [Verrucomicrobiota bacterium]|jgi:arylsulfatase A-like enzyme|nr:sulfatase-like hydrolase/transferase [Verrucomicrobiota bacterium]MEC7902543.1 sulfatase-like hydrolase/transferase [Candidatus Neomarinimicrobiota bacterium]|tara:strand:- start:3489 stop:5009 length:1521 start_codon:yes stop_codon:yes gene_type:complete